MNNTLAPIIFTCIGLIILLVNRSVSKLIIEANLGENNELKLSTKGLYFSKLLVRSIVVLLGLSITAFGIAGLFIPIKY